MEEMTTLIAAMAGLQAEIKGLKEAHGRTRESVTNLDGKLDKLIYMLMAGLGGLALNVLSHLWRG